MFLANSLSVKSPDLLANSFVDNSLSYKNLNTCCRIAIVILAIISMFFLRLACPAVSDGSTSCVRSPYPTKMTSGRGSRSRNRIRESSWMSRIPCKIQKWNHVLIAFCLIRLSFQYIANNASNNVFAKSSVKF